MARDYFPSRPDMRPMIYAYSSTNPNDAGLLKVGFTTIGVEERVAQQFPTLHPSKQYTIVLEESAMRSDGTYFKDYDVHRVLRKKGIQNVGGEWFRCEVRDVLSAILAVKNRTENIENRDQSFAMRPEQARAVKATANYFALRDRESNSRMPRYLWNCKMRFGKTFAAYQLAKRMGAKRVLILTFKPAVQSAWEEDLERHIDFEGWQFFHRESDYDRYDKERPIVCFGSFQDYLRLDPNGQIKEKYTWVRETVWDLVIFDEYHYGAWRERANSLFKAEDEETEFDEEKYEEKEASTAIDETFLPISASHFLYLSGTPFRALNSGDFMEEQIFSWTYQDEQKAKEEWRDEDGPNPYASLPRVVMMTYKIPDNIKSIAEGGEFNEFDLNSFFKAEGRGENARFKHEEYVQNWLKFIQNGYDVESVLKDEESRKRPPMPFNDIRLLNILTHTLWFLPDVASCFAMRNLLRSRVNDTFFRDYEIIVAAGTLAGVGLDALPPVYEAMRGARDEGPLKTKTITLTCGKLTTGVTVRPWTGIFMLRNSQSPETYFQTAFRVQSPWTIRKADGTEEILKKECYIFDFAPNRALKQLADYSVTLKVGEDAGMMNHEACVAEFTNYLPVLAYDGYTMEEVNAAQILQMIMTGTTYTMLAKRWQDARLVNVKDMYLQRLLNNPDLLKALEGIEDFRNLSQDLSTIITKSEKIKDVKKLPTESADKPAKKELTQEEKEMKSLRRQVQEKLIKLATRIPIFMYLTDTREYSLKDVIMAIEPELFEKVTGLKVSDFDLLCRLEVFDSKKMNESVYYFKRYEDSSLSYTGLWHDGNAPVGLYDTVITREEFENKKGDI